MSFDNYKWEDSNSIIELTWKDEYDYFFTDEHFMNEVGERKFEVIFNEDGEQEDIVDLNGEW
jgi:hypothetical protein